MEEGYSQLTRQSTPSSPAQPPIHPGGRRGRTCAANQIRSTPSAPKKKRPPEQNSIILTPTVSSTKKTRPPREVPYLQRRKTRRENRTLRPRSLPHLRKLFPRRRRDVCSQRLQGIRRGRHRHLTRHPPTQTITQNSSIMFTCSVFSHVIFVYLL